MSYSTADRPSMILHNDSIETLQTRTPFVAVTFNGPAGSTYIVPSTGSPNQGLSVKFEGGETRTVDAPTARVSVGPRRRLVHRDLKPCLEEPSTASASAI